jgi:hypothetical protein
MGQVYIESNPSALDDKRYCVLVSDIAPVAMRATAPTGLPLGTTLALFIGRKTTPKDEINMLYTIAVVLLILWALGLVTSYTMGGFIHILLVVAIVMVLIQVIQGRRL